MKAKPLAKLEPRRPIDADAPEPIAVRMPADIRSVALTILAAIAVILFLQHAQALIIPFVLGVLISYALSPVVTGMTRFKIPRAVAAAVVLLTVVGTAGALLYELRFEASAIVGRFLTPRGVWGARWNRIRRERRQRSRMCRRPRRSSKRWPTPRPLSRRRRTA